MVNAMIKVCVCVCGGLYQGTAAADNGRRRSKIDKIDNNYISVEKYIIFFLYKYVIDLYLYNSRLYEHFFCFRKLWCWPQEVYLLLETIYLLIYCFIYLSIYIYIFRLAPRILWPLCLAALGLGGLDPTCPRFELVF